MAETSKQAGAYKRLREAAGKAEKCSAEAQELLDQYNCDREMAKKLKATVATAQEVSAEVDGSAEDATGPRYAARAFEARRIAEEVSRKKRDGRQGAADSQEETCPRKFEQQGALQH